MSQDVTIILAGLDGKPHDPMCSMNQSHWRTDYNWNHSDNQFCMLCPIIETVREDERQRVLAAARDVVAGQCGHTKSVSSIYECDHDRALAAIDALRGES